MIRSPRERGAVLVVALMISIALAGIAGVVLGRLVYEKRRSEMQEESSRALFEAHGELAKAEAILNASPYDVDTSRNIALMDGLAAEPPQILGTTVAVTPMTDMSGTFFRLTSSRRIGSVTRTVEALVREKESFANYNYFVNSHPLGISGRPTPRGSLHTNRGMVFYLPNGTFTDPVTAADGFTYTIGATEENTTFLGPTDPAAATVSDLTNLDLAELRGLADIYLLDDPTFDAKLLFDGDQVYVEKWSQWHTEEEPVFSTFQREIGTETVTVSEEIEHFRDEIYQVTVDDLELQDEVYQVDVPVWDVRTVERSRDDPVYDTRSVERTNEIPVFEDQVVTLTRDVQVWVEDDLTDADGGTAIAGGGDRPPGHWETVQEEYQETISVQIDTIIETYWEDETYIADWVTVTWNEDEDYIREWVTEDRTRQVWVKIGEHEEDRTRQVLDWVETVTHDEEQPVYEWVTEQTGTHDVWVPPALVEAVTLGAAQGVIYVEGDILSLKGQLNGRVTVVSGGSVNITGNLQYVDDYYERAYSNGTNPGLPYEPNPNYTGQSVLGVVADEDILYRSSVPSNFELNGSLLAKNGRVGITGIQLDAEGDVSLTGGTYVRNSIRRLGGIITNERPVTTYVNDDYEVVAGFQKGISIYDRRLTYQPPIGFPERLRPKELAIVSKVVHQ